MEHALHRRLLTSHLAVELSDRVHALCCTLPRGFADLRSQATRAADSVPRHIAEGANRISPADKASRFRIAMGELGEVDACIDIIQRRAAIDPTQLRATQGLLARVSGGLNGLTRRLERMSR